MKVDVYQMDLEQARVNKAWNELGIDRRTISKIRHGKNVSPLFVAKLAAALGVDPERITVRGDQ